VVSSSTGFTAPVSSASASSWRRLALSAPSERTSAACHVTASSAFVTTSGTPSPENSTSAPTTSSVCRHAGRGAQALPASAIAARTASNAGRRDQSARSRPLWKPPRSASSIRWKRSTSVTAGSQASVEMTCA
jgi:hypothetical protein